MALPRRDAGSKRRKPSSPGSDAAQRSASEGRARRARPTGPARTDSVGNRPANAPRPRAPRPAPARDLGRLVGRAVTDPLGLLGLPSKEEIEYGKRLPRVEREIRRGEKAGPPAPYVQVRAKRTDERRKLYPATAFDTRSGKTVPGSVDRRGNFRAAKPTEFDAVTKFLGGLAARADEGLLVTTGGGGPAGALGKKNNPFAAALAGGPVQLKGTPSGRIIEDLASIPAMAPSAIFELVNAAGGLATGNTKPAGELADALGESAIVKLLTLDPKGAAKAAEEHPGYAVLDLLGFKAALGKGTGAALRHAPSERARRLGSTERASLKLHKDIEVGREYSRDIIDKAIQVFIDRSVEKRNVSEGLDPLQVTNKQRERLRGSQPLDTALARDFDIENDMDLERVKRGRNEEKHTADKILPDDAENPVAALMVEGRIPPKVFRQKLEEIAARLDAEEPGLRGRPKHTTNREQAAAVRAALDDKDLMADPAGALAKLMPYIERSNALEAEMVRLNYLDPKRQDPAKLAPAKIEHMGAEPTPEGPRRPVDVAQAGRDVAYRNGLGAKHIMESDDLSHVRSFTIPPDRSKGAKGTHRMSPGQVAAIDRKLTREGFAREDLPDGSTRWVREAKATVEMQRVSDKATRDLLRALGQEDVAFLAHRPFVSSRSKHFQGSGAHAEDRGQIASKSRSGKGTAEGSTPVGKEYLTDELASKRVKVETIKAVNRQQNRYVVGSFEEPSHALEEVKRIEANGGPRMEVLSLHPSIMATKQTRKAVDEDISTIGLEEMLQRHGLALPPKGADPEGLGGPYGLIPTAVADRIRAFDKLTGNTDALKALELFTGHFRQIVLFTSTRWVTGNGVEAAVRGLSAGINPAHVMLGAKLGREGGVMQLIDPEAYADFAALNFTGAQIGAQAKRFDRVRRSDQMNPNKLPFKLARAMEVVMAHDGPRQFGDAWHVWKAGVTAMNHAFERTLEYGALGKFASGELQRMNSSMVKAMTVQGDMLDDLARGVLHETKARRIAKYVDDVRGRYSKLRPAEKQAVLYYAPFAMWYLNALKFCLVTLPKDRPVQTAFLASYSETHEDLRELQDWLKDGGDYPHYYARGAVEIGGKLRPLQRYMPFGALSADPLAQPASFVFPQATFLLNNLAGFDFGKRVLQVNGQDATDGDRIWTALWALADTVTPFMIPAATVAREGGVTQGGRDHFSGKPGTEVSVGAGVEKAVNPLHAYNFGFPDFSDAPAKKSKPVAAAPKSRLDTLLERRAQLLEGRSAQSQRLEELLERRAELLGG